MYTRAGWRRQTARVGRVLRRHHPNTGIARAQDVVEGNLDQPRDEEVMERKVDEGTAA